MILLSFSRRHSAVIAMALLAVTTLPAPGHSFPWKDDGDNDNEYMEPEEGQLRSPCPAINTIANHGYIDRSGRDVLLQDLSQGLDDVFGLPAAVILAAITIAIPALGIESEFTKAGQRIDLDALFKHGAMEHDASLVREDFYFEGNSLFSQALFDDCVNSSSNKEEDALTVWGIARCSSERVLDTRRNNPTAYDFEGGPISNINLGAVVAAMEAAFEMAFGDDPAMLRVSKDDLESVLKFNRIPDNYNRRSVVEWLPLVYSFSVTLRSNLKALLVPVEKADGSWSAPSPAEATESFFSSLKTLATYLSSSGIPEAQALVPFVETLIADLEDFASSL